MTPIAPHITAYLRERLPLQRGASPHTCDSYAHTYRLLFEFASERLKVTPSKLFLEQIDAQMVMDFLAYLESIRSNSASTRNARLAAIKSFMRFVEHRVPSVLEQSLRILAIPIKKCDTALINYLCMDEMQALLNAPDIRTGCDLNLKQPQQKERQRDLFFAKTESIVELLKLMPVNLKCQQHPVVSSAYRQDKISVL